MQQIVNESVQPGQQVLVFRLKKDKQSRWPVGMWSVGSVVRWNPHKDTVRVRYSNKTEETHLRVYHHDGDYQNNVTTIRENLRFLGLHWSYQAFRENCIDLGVDEFADVDPCTTAVTIAIRWLHYMTDSVNWATTTLADELLSGNLNSSEQLLQDARAMLDQEHKVRKNLGL